MSPIIIDRILIPEQETVCRFYKAMRAFQFSASGQSFFIYYAYA